MEAGRELDALVAEKVMGWHVTSGRNEDGDERTVLLDAEGDEVGYEYGGDVPMDAFAELPHYSTDAVAWQIVEHLRPYAMFTLTDRGGASIDSRRWEADFFQLERDKPPVPHHGRAHADTAPHAICLAALRAVGVEV